MTFFRKKKTIRLKNNSSNPLRFQYVKIPFFEVSPAFGKIMANDTLEVNVTLTPRNIGKYFINHLCYLHSYIRLSLFSHCLQFTLLNLKKTQC